jgi:crotonobetainyl-CoA:carnitine CoA-transferase CaiB-like acyl-CoA transferase
MGGPLQGIKILDLTQYVAGPFCSMMLGDMGAEVIKIEPVDRGDIYRVQGPNFINGLSTSFLGVNRSKKSMTLNLKDPEGKKIAHKLVKRVDVVIENFKPGTAEKLGLGYDELKKINPRLIYASISGYGQTGPEAKRAGYDLMAQGRAGIMLITGNPDSPPCKVGVPIVDMGAAMYTAYGIAAALLVREKTKKGQMIDVSLLDTAVSWFTILAMEYQATGQIPQKLGSASPLFAPYQAFKAKDGYINIIGTGGKDHWQRFCKALGHKEWANDERFSDNIGRISHLNELTQIIEEVLVTKTVDEWERLFTEAGLASDSLQAIDKMMKDPQVIAREMVIEKVHPTVGRLKFIGIPVKLSETPGEIEQLPPMMGEHTKQILIEMGYTEIQIKGLRKKKII